MLERQDSIVHAMLTNNQKVQMLLRLCQQGTETEVVGLLVTRSHR